MQIYSRAMADAICTSWEFMKDESNRYLLGDEEGYLYVFSIETSHNKVVNLSSTFIGQVPSFNQNIESKANHPQVSRPSCIVDLGNLMFYIGSTHGDSCLIQLIKGQEKSKYTVKVLSTYSCLGPIVDFCLYDYNKQGKVQRKTLVSVFFKPPPLLLANHGLLCWCRKGCKYKDSRKWYRIQ